MASKKKVSKKKPSKKRAIKSRLKSTRQCLAIVNGFILLKPDRLTERVGKDGSTSVTLSGSILLDDPGAKELQRLLKASAYATLQLSHRGDTASRIGNGLIEGITSKLAGSLGYHIEWMGECVAVGGKKAKRA
jgi:hypothetical protein